MNWFSRKLPTKAQYFLSALLVLAVSLICFFFKNLVGYQVVALILLMAVSLAAMLFEILPVLLAAVLSAVIWNFFFIPPLYTFYIGNAEDALMFLLYFVVALVNAVLTFKIREADKKARDKEEKEKELKLYNTLLNSLSHELRTPIAAIIGSVDILKESKDKLSDENLTDELLNEIAIAGNRLNRQVENILNMSRLESGMLRPKSDWMDMNELVNSVIQLFPDNEHNLVFKNSDDLPLFKLDNGLTEQILYNLLQNAVQYTPPNTRIEIEVTHQSEYCMIIVSDDGNGFPAKEMSLVFNKFYRLPNTKTGGSGLGLSIVKGFTEAQSGRIKLENNEKGGAKFTVEIPAETSYLNNLKNE